MEEAASIPLVSLTAWQALVEKANLKKGAEGLHSGGFRRRGHFRYSAGEALGATVATTTSSTNVALVKSLGADVVIDYKMQNFEDVLHDYDVVLNSQDGTTLAKSLRVLKGGGKGISISGPPDPEFGQECGAPWFLRLIIRLLSAGVRKEANRRDLKYPSRDRLRVSIRINQRSFDVRRSRPRQRQSRGQAQGSLTFLPRSFS